MCLNTTQNNFTLANTYCNQTDLLAVVSISSDNWNYASPATAGIIGIASGSSIWPLFNINTTNPFYYSVQFQNVTDWSFMNASAPAL